MNANIIGVTYLHTHPVTQKQLGVNSDHVIVDRKEYETIVKYFRNHPEEFYNMIEESESEKTNEQEH